MAELKDKLDFALNESRILILVGQVFIGFSYRAYFEPGFEHLTPAARAMLTIGLTTMLVATGLLLVPPPYHRLAERGEINTRFHGVVSVLLGIALFPMAVALGADLFVVGEVVGGTRAAWSSAVLGLVTALVAWYGIELIRLSPKTKSGLTAVLKSDERTMPKEKSESTLTEKIKEVLIEARMVLPGTQALAGFQFIIMLMDRFPQIPRSSQYIHFASLCCVTLSSILLIMPAAYHRIVFHGEDSEEFHRHAGHMLLAALVFLGLGTCGDFLVVCRMVLHSFRAALLMSLLLLALFYGMWFGWTMYRRHQLLNRKLIA